MLAASGIVVGIVVATSVGQTLTPLQPIGLLASRRWRQGPQHVPVNCVEGWSVGATWRGLRLLDLVVRAGGGPGSSVRAVSLEQGGIVSDIDYARHHDLRTAVVLRASAGVGIRRLVFASSMVVYGGGASAT